MPVLRPQLKDLTNVEDNVVPKTNDATHYTIQKELGPYSAAYIKKHDLSPRMQDSYKQHGINYSPTKRVNKPEPIKFKKSTPAIERQEVKAKAQAMEEYLTVYNLKATDNRPQQLTAAKDREQASKQSNYEFELMTQHNIREKENQHRKD